MGTNDWIKLRELFGKTTTLGPKPQNLKRLRDFIGRRSQALELSTRSTHKASEGPCHKGNSQKNSQNTQNYKSSVEKCPCCSENHRVYTCKKFTDMSLKDQKNLVWTLKLCFNCLNSSHITKECKSKHTCKTCLSKPNTLLHLHDAPKGAVSGSLTTNQATTEMPLASFLPQWFPLKMVLQESPCAEP